MKVLIVDDSKAMRLIVRRNLREAGFSGFDIVEKVNGQEALDFLRTDKVDLVLSDWNMPEMTGIQLLNKLKEEGNGTKFGFVTSEGSAEMRTEASASGSLFLITKPFTAEDFSKTLSKYFGG